MIRNPYHAFRALVVADFLIVVISVFLGFLAPEETNEEINRRAQEGLPAWFDQFYEALPDSSKIFVAGGGLIALGSLVILGLLIYVGLYLFWNWARFVNLFGWVAYVILCPFLGWSILPPLDAAVATVSGLLGGAILGVSFFPPISARFRSPARDRAQSSPKESDVRKLREDPPRGPVGGN